VTRTSRLQAIYRAKSMHAANRDATFQKVAYWESGAWSCRAISRKTLKETQEKLTSPIENAIVSLTKRSGDNGFV
jgi:hypothetical protein